MNKIYQVYQVSDSTGETLDRIFLAIKAQFSNFKCKTIHYSFTRTENQINKIITKCNSEQNVIILYTIVDGSLAKYLITKCRKNNIPCFEVLGNLITNFAKLLKQEASHKPSGQHILGKDYYNRIEAIQFTMSHDDGKIISDLDKSDVVLVGISRTSKTPTSIYLANRGYKVTNIPIIPNKNLPKELIENPNKIFIVGLICDVNRLLDVRRNRTQSMHEDRQVNYTNELEISNEIENSKKIFKKNNWPIIDVTRKSVEETAASIIKILDILNSK
ncbi:MAG: phosphoenolpyruvate synthase regulatory protein [Candidatus Pelagibacter sp.]|nr:phosphoenolpyruvate synthase regulatory protein [Candidatus Pelagibacter sp.]|tara:strand:+ start:2417 stop:3238 length:822 start_codon:yes stop_codon:yes gene_type:complete